MGDAVIEEAMMATSLMDDGLIDGTYDAYADMASFSANLCDVVQEEDIGIYSPPEEPETYVNRSKRLTCKRCGQAFRNKVLLKKHSAIHGKDQLFECEECSKKFNRKESLTRHKLVHTGMKFYECQECGRMFNQNGHLRTHMLIHTKEKNFQCEKCNMKFARKDNMKRHSLLHSRKRSFECSVCGKRFNQNGHLEAHMLVHTQEKNFQCQQCVMKFARRDTLKRHMLVHTKEKTFECDFCYEKFIQNSHLKAHILVHTLEKKFSCTDCNKKFARKGSLKRHMLVHTGERNFECPECAKTFIQKTHLNKHQLIHSSAREKMSEDRVDKFIQNIHKVEVQIEQENTEKCEPNDESKKDITLQPVPLVTMKNDVPARNPTESERVTPASTTSKATSVSKQTPVISKTIVASPLSCGAGETSVISSTLQHGIPEQIAVDTMQQCSGESTQTFNHGNTVSRQRNMSHLPHETQVQNSSQMQPNNLLANSNSVMALALLDHFLTGNESQENVVAEPTYRGKGGHQWAQKTQQELLAAQTLSAIGQKTTLVSDSHHQAYGQGAFTSPQIMTTCNFQPMQQAVLATGPVMKGRPPSNAEWMSQEKIFVHPQNVVYNVPPPAHEIFRYYSPTNVPLPHAFNNRDYGQFKDGIPRLPEGSCIPADMRASPRKSKFPQKVVLPLGEWQSTVSVPSGSANPSMHVYAHSKHHSEVPR